MGQRPRSASSVHAKSSHSHQKKARKRNPKKLAEEQPKSSNSTHGQVEKRRGHSEKSASQRLRRKKTGSKRSTSHHSYTPSRSKSLGGPKSKEKPRHRSRNGERRRPKSQSRSDYSGPAPPSRSSRRRLPPKPPPGMKLKLKKRSSEDTPKLALVRSRSLTHSARSGESPEILEETQPAEETPRLILPGIVTYDKTQWENVTLPKDDPFDGGIGTQDVKMEETEIPGENLQKPRYERLAYLDKLPKIMISIRFTQMVVCLGNMGALVGPHAEYLSVEFGNAGIPVCMALLFIVGMMSCVLGIVFFLRRHIGKDKDRLKNNWRFASILMDQASMTILLTAATVAFYYSFGYPQMEFGMGVVAHSIHPAWIVSGTLSLLQVAPCAYLFYQMLQKGPGPNF